MRTTAAFIPAILLALAACSGGTAPDGTSGGPAGESAAPTTGGGGAGSGGAVVDRQPPGQGAASVDGLEFSFDTPGGIACTVSDEEFGFSFIQGDNEVTIGGGATISGGQWFGSLTMRVAAEDGVTEYAAQLVDHPSGVAVDGSSVSYSGPMLRYSPAPPGELPKGVDVGDGVFSATC